jgi:3-deoxy-D-arabino-heptulosonate 7-phosphate (DAHP) synthase
MRKIAEVYKSAILVKSQKAEIFQVGKRNIANRKIMNKWGNAKIALPR